MYQAGIKKITLYENLEIDFGYWDANDLTQITGLLNNGEIIEITNLQRPTFESEAVVENSVLLNSYTVNFLLFGYISEQGEVIEQLNDSINGWCMLVEFYDGTTKFYNFPIFLNKSETKPHEEATFSVALETRTPTQAGFFNYTPGIAIGEIFRWDSEILTWDSEIVTFDYEL